MQQDLTDAVGWAVKEGFADEARVAIMGGSYGGLAPPISILPPARPPPSPPHPPPLPTSRPPARPSPSPLRSHHGAQIVEVL
jgi:hypothetical protein